MPASGTGLVTLGLSGDTETVRAATATSGKAVPSGGALSYTAPASGTDKLGYSVTDEFGPVTS